MADQLDTDWCRTTGTVNLCRTTDTFKIGVSRMAPIPICNRFKKGSVVRHRFRFASDLGKGQSYGTNYFIWLSMPLKAK
ncbi:MAG: hypothetical protein NT027_10580 [Proteobacteria bacterium]|nr:hypothetical protein [Pseudomonadota bacterium]